MELVINSKTYGEQILYFDNEDYDRLKDFTLWIYKSRKTLYVLGRKPTKIGGDGKTINIHRFIMNCADKTLQIDHKDRNGLNNKKENLRVCTQVQNTWNRKGVNESKYKGVFYNKRYKRFLATLTVNNEVKYGGYYDYELLAAEKYNQLAIEYHGEYAHINVFTEKEKKQIEWLKTNPLPKRKRIGSSKGKFGKDHGKSKSIIKYNINGDYLATYESMSQAAKENNINLPHLSVKLSKGINIVCGYKWELK